MSNESSLSALVQAGEGEALEFKERWTPEALKTLAAFANTRGGILLVGVDDRGQAKGVGRGQTASSRRSSIRSQTD
jgi:ATP-dependent DNA helicase RecG